MAGREKELLEVIIPSGYALEEFFDTENELEEEPIFSEEVKIRFE